MTVRRILDKADNHVSEAEYISRLLDDELQYDKLIRLRPAKLESLEEDAWKNVMRIDEHLDAVREMISSVCYYDEFEMSTSDKIRAMVALNERKDKILESRQRLTDDVIRKIVNREKALLLATGLKRGGGPGDTEEG